MNKFLQDAQDYLPILLQGAVTTAGIAFCALVIATLFGLVLALMRYSGIGVLSWTARSFVNIVRGIPILVQLFYIYFVLPDFGIDLTAFQAGAIGLGIAYSCYMAENFRAGLEAVDKGQVEAAQSIGMSWVLTMRRVVLPQAFRTVLPPYGNTMIMLLKDTSQASVITVAEITFQGKMLAASTFENMTVYTLVAGLYLAFSVPLFLLASYLERRFGKK
ncbi:amino acid ABC transporter permease [Pseudooceanicola sp. CBS1P-1]|uniref:Putative glutamine transport system permease protein GlnP n=1 Tax=Pseudooceanicola albus TaxID=2692189 RepID=A0A6L7G1L4_9RHOB|nr:MULTISPECIES: amino acid ABC transporter permease [Pseudooceanicola]MBT9383748.1 amino acid ABC transporter permease [Pseudooceanicola endophyticus]MXN17602.1 ABC transporter permease subunit [Pseudooceanicola albus]